MFTVRHYSQALFESAREEKKLDKILTDLELVFFAIKENKDFKKYLLNPEISLDKKITVAKNIFSSKISESIYNLVSLLVKKNNLNFLEDIFYNFKKRALEEKNILEVNATFAADPKKSDENAIVKTLEEKTSKKVKLIKSINPKILGGMVIKIEDMLINLSLKHRLELLHKNISEVKS